MFTLESHDYEKHMLRLTEFTPCVESHKEIRSSPLSYELGFTDCQVVMDSVISSEEAWVFCDASSRKIIGIAGIAKGVVNGELAMLPWFLTSGFERLPENRRLFLKAAQELLKSFEKATGGKLMINTCLNDKRITKFLKFLGFTVEPSFGEFTTFWKKGGTTQCVQQR
jgi:hypothetical protein